MYLDSGPCGKGWGRVYFRRKLILMVPIMRKLYLSCFHCLKCITSDYNTSLLGACELRLIITSVFTVFFLIYSGWSYPLYTFHFCCTHRSFFCSFHTSYFFLFRLFSFSWWSMNIYFCLITNILFYIPLIFLALK